MTSPASQFWLRKRPNSYRSNFKVTFVDPYYPLEKRATCKSGMPSRKIYIVLAPCYWMGPFFWALIVRSPWMPKASILIQYFVVHFSAID